MQAESAYTNRVPSSSLRLGSLKIAPIQPVSNQQPSPEPLKILIVDDAVQLATALRELLTEIGYRAWNASSGAEALRQLEAAHFDLVLLDIMLPDIDGYALCRQIRQAYSIPVVIMSGLRHHERTANARAAGASFFVGKPFSLSELGGAIDEAFRQHFTDARLHYKQ
jgi:two-component system OmpR family response regulator